MSVPGVLVFRSSLASVHSVFTDLVIQMECQRPSLVLTPTASCSPTHVCGLRQGGWTFSSLSCIGRLTFLRRATLLCLNGGVTSQTARVCLETLMHISNGRFLLNVYTGVLVYGGNGLYRLDAGDLDWPAEEIGIQVDISRASSLRQQASMGNCQYSAKYIRDDVKGTYTYVMLTSSSVRNFIVSFGCFRCEEHL